MRITSDAKLETRKRILKAARVQFRSQGFDATSTRGLANEAGIAAGTLFNYFATKESLAIAIAAEAFERAESEFERHLTGRESLEEILFSYIVTGLRQLTPDRAYIGAVLHNVWSGFSITSLIEEAAELREHHLERVGQFIHRQTADGAFDFHIQLHLYWTLYLGVLAFWARDDSAGQEKTLAMLDHVIRMFTKSLIVERNLNRESRVTKADGELREIGKGAIGQPMQNAE